jgi:MFS transporter, DHA1 family, multidrug resistance protein B
VTLRADRPAPPTLRSLHPALRLRLVVAFAERTLTAMVVPIMAIYLSAAFGAGTAGLLIVISVGVAVAAGLSSGHLADALGRRRALLLGALAMTAGFAGMALAVSPPLAAPLLAFACYAVQVAAGSFIQPVHDAVIIDVTVPAERTVVYTLNYWSFNLALAAGVLLAGFLYDGHLLALLVGASACSLAAAGLTYRYLVETAPPRELPGAVAGRPASAAAGGGTAGGVAGGVAGGGTAAGGAVTGRAVGGAAGRGAAGVLRGYLMPLRDRRFMALLVAFTLVLGLEMQRTTGYVAVRLAQQVPPQGLFPWAQLPRVTGIQLVGLLQAVNTVAVAVLALASERLLGRMAPGRRIAGGIGVFTVACAVMATTGTAWVLLLAVLALTIGELMHIPVMQTVLAEVIPERSRAKYLAVFNLNVRGGMVIASLGLSAGAVLPPGGIAALYLALGAAAVLLYRPLLAGHRAAAPAGARAGARAGAPQVRPHPADRDRTPDEIQEATP